MKYIPAIRISKSASLAILLAGGALINSALESRGDGISGGWCAITGCTMYGAFNQSPANPTNPLIINNNTTLPSSYHSGTLLELTAGNSKNMRITLDTYNAGATFTGQRANGTLQSLSALAGSEPQLVTLQGLGYDGTAYGTGGVINIQPAGTAWTTSSHSSQINFEVVPYNSVTTITAEAILNTGLSSLTGIMAGQGTKFTASGCSNSTTVGGATAGSFSSGTTGTCTVTITMNGATGLLSNNGWVCTAFDITTPADTIKQSGSTTAGCTITGTTASGDTIVFSAIGY
jgi:hypothetical protein